jgi:hypothetical protein
MNPSEFPWLLILESILPFVILSAVLIFIILGGRKKFKQAAKSLILSVKSSEDQEKQAVISFLTEKLALDDKAAKKKAKKILNERKFLIRNLVSGLLDKNVQSLSELNQDLSRITAHYHGLDVNIAAVENEPSDEENEPLEEPNETDSEKGLKKEIKSLKKEIHITLTTLNNIFNEFSSMFGEDDTPGGQMSVDQIITAMESFSNKSINVSGNQKPIEGADDSTITAEAELSKAESNTLTDNEVLDSQDGAEDNKTESDITEEIETSNQHKEELDFSVDSAIDDIDSALDELELDTSDDEEPDWGDAFAESGDVMEEEEIK